MKLTVHSLRKEQIRTYNDRSCEYDDNILYVLNCLNGNDKYELSLWTEYGDCFSGYCPASFGHGRMQKVKNFSGMTHKAIRKLTFEIEEYLDPTSDIPDMENEIFSIEHDGGDSYYPAGEVCVNEELFTETNRYKPVRPVWIFKGGSALGKSYIAGIFGNSSEVKTVYETDAHEVLDEAIEADIIVVGNKYNHTLEEIEAKIQGEHETIYVDFSKKEG